MVNIILAAHGRITTRYKQDIGRGWLHNGIDQGHTNGTAYDLQIMAPADGIVTATGRQGSYGNRLVIRHDDGSRSLLAHHASQLVTVGQRVTQGQIIAVMGNTGTKYVHSHQEFWEGNGNQLDPLKNLVTLVAASTAEVIIEVTPEPEEEDMRKFIVAPNGVWYITDGLHKRELAPSENQIMVDLGLVKYSDKEGGVEPLSQSAVDRIPTVK